MVSPFRAATYLNPFTTAFFPTQILSTLTPKPSVQEVIRGVITFRARRAAKQSPTKEKKEPAIAGAPSAGRKNKESWDSSQFQPVTPRGLFVHLFHAKPKNAAIVTNT